MATTVPLRGASAARSAHPARPSTVTLSVALWLGAILAGVAETLVHLTGPDAPTADAVSVRFGIYVMLTVLVLALRGGGNAVRWVVAILLGGLGTGSLVVEPVRYLVDGGSAGLFLATASGADMLVAALRSLHVVEVLAALVLLFAPASTAWFRRR